MAWACCCCSVFVIILSFFLAIYLPITAFANGAKLRLVHVGELESCIVFESWPLLLPWSMPMDKRYRELMHAQMAQVNVSNLCSDPMVLQFRAQVTNPAHVIMASPCLHPPATTSLPSLAESLSTSSFGPASRRRHDNHV